MKHIPVPTQAPSFIPTPPPFPPPKQPVISARGSVAQVGISSSSGAPPPDQPISSSAHSNPQKMFLMHYRKMKEYADAAGVALDLREDFAFGKAEIEETQDVVVQSQPSGRAAVEPVVLEVVDALAPWAGKGSQGKKGKGGDSKGGRIVQTDDGGPMFLMCYSS